MVLQWLNLAFLNSLLLSVLLALVANLGDRDLARDVQSAVAVFDMGDMSSCPGRHCGGGGITSISKKVTPTHAAPTSGQRILGMA